MSALRTSGMVVCALVLTVTLMGVGFAPVAGQEESGSTPEDDGEQQVTQDPVVTPTPVVGSTSGRLQAPQETPPAETEGETTSGPVASTSDSDLSIPVLTQGLIYLNGGDVVWQVREVEIIGTDAESVVGNARVILQRSGVSVIRNDVTGKRARLEPGEAYFASAGDPYSAMADNGEQSVVWVFEISNSSDVGPSAFYLSPDVSGYPEAVYDFEFSRNVVGGGESAEFEGQSGPSLLVVLSGDVSVDTGDDSANLTAQDGLVVDNNATITAENGQAVYVAMTVGPEVSDATAADPEPVETPTDDTSGETAAEEVPAEEAPVEEPPADTGQQTGEFVTSIAVTATEGLSVSIYADGALVFEGWLEAGQSTAYFNGSVFEVYTTSGENTVFTNACGGDFLMGYETGDAYYYLEATEESCAPIG